MMAKLRTMAVQQDTVYIFPRVASAEIFDSKAFKMKRSPGRIVIFINGLREVGRNPNRLVLLEDSQGFRLRGQPSCLQFPCVSLPLSLDLGHPKTSQNGSQKTEADDRGPIEVTHPPQDSSTAGKSGYVESAYSLLIEPKLFVIPC